MKYEYIMNNKKTLFNYKTIHINNIHNIHNINTFF